MSRFGRGWGRVLALGLALGVVGCGSGGSAASPAAPQGARTIASVRWVPETVAAYNSQPVRLAGGGDDYLMILSEPSRAGGNATVRLNGGTRPVPPLPSQEGRALVPGGRRHVPVTRWNALLDGGRGRGLAGATPTRQASDPALGSARQFWVYGDEGYTLVTATLREKGRHSLLYVDDATEAGALTAANIADLRAKFDNEIYPTDTALLGPTGDIDRNGRVVILVSPAVDSTSAGYVNTDDLRPGAGHDAELLYIAAPRPSAGQTYAQLRESVHATMAHELVHLIVGHHKWQLGDEEGWLNEGMAFVTEQANGYLEVLGGIPDLTAWYFSAPEQYTARETRPDYALGHAGVNYLFARYLADRFGEGVLGRLVRSRMTGEQNVRLATGHSYATLQPEFAAALALAGTGKNDDPRYALPSFNPRGEYKSMPYQLTGPATTELAAASGRPAVAISWPRGGLRYVWLTDLPPSGALIQFSTTDTRAQATFLRAPVGWR